MHEILNLLSNKFHLFKFHIGQLITMKHPRTKKCSICENRYAFKPLATSAFDPAEKRFVVLPLIQLDAQTTRAMLAVMTMKIHGTHSTLSWTSARIVYIINNVTKCVSTLTWTNVDLSNKKTHGEHEGNCRQLQGTHHERRSPYRIVSLVCYHKKKTSFKKKT